MTQPAAPEPHVDVDAVAGALQPAFRVLPGASRQQARVCLDTFDWRLHRRKLSCQIIGTGTGRILVLDAADGRRLQAPLPAGVRTPLRLSNIPAGPVHERLAEVIDVRALLPRVYVEASVREVRVLDDVDKTVVRLDVESATAALRRGDAAVPVPTSVHLHPVRGYEAHARSVAAALHGAGIRVSTESLAYEAVGLTPGQTPGTADPRPTPHMAAPVAVASVLRAFLDEIEANVPGAIADIDVEFVHDLRISVRRSRSALKLAGDVLPSGTAERFGGELKWLGDVTTPVRDLDVHLLDLPKLAGRLEAFSPGDLDAFGEHLARHRRGEVKAMAQALSSRRYQTFVRSWRGLLDAVVAGRSFATAGVLGVSVGRLAATRVARADRRVVKLGRQITPQSPAEDLHTLRKRAKELRYVLDLFAAVLDPAKVKPLIAELKALQDVLGAFQDSEVQREALRRFAGEMVAEASKVPVDTLLALGELATHLEVDQRRARGHFDERFAAFMRPVVRRHVEALGVTT